MSDIWLSETKIKWFIPSRKYKILKFTRKLSRRVRRRIIRERSFLRNNIKVLIENAAGRGIHIDDIKKWLDNVKLS